MKAGVYSPYLDTLGGGERYTLSIAILLKRIGFIVDIFSSQLNLAKYVKNRFGLDISGIALSPKGEKILSKAGNLFQKFNLTRKYDLIFFVSDGSIPSLFSKTNLIHFQVPFIEVGGKSLNNQLKLKNIHQVICNSKFTKKYIDDEFNTNSLVVYPPVKKIIKSTGKENIILSVGRFDNLLSSKRQDVLIRAFKKLKPKNWQLILAGGLLRENKFMKDLKKSTSGYSISVRVNLSHQELSRLYSRAKIFWHAAGYGLDITNYPQKAEHFGISTVEAMSAGAIPLVFNGGGLKEIIKSGSNGYLWQTLDELIYKTKTIIKSQNNNSVINQAILRSADFSEEIFYEQIKQIIS